ncbi:MAG: GntR family transcriptional regulator [Tangfeifania sp.]
MIQHSDLSIPVYERLKEMILNNELAPGEKLLQEKLATQLGVSRTPLLKALQMLEYDLLVESIPRRGMFVKKITAKELIEIYDVREGIESVAVRLVIDNITAEKIAKLQSIWQPFVNQTSINTDKYQKADDKFHALLLEYSENKILKKTYSNSLLQGRVMQMGLMRPPQETLPEHLALTEAIKKGDYKKADQEIKKNIRKSKVLIEQNLSRTGK